MDPSEEELGASSSQRTPEKGWRGGGGARPAGSLGGQKGRTGGGAGKPRPAARSGGAAHSPLCSPRNTSLNFLSGFPKSPPADMMEPEEPPPPPQPTDLSQTAAAPTGWRRGPSGRAAAESSRPLQEGQAEGRGSTLHRPAAAAAAASPQSRLAPCEARGREGTQGGVGGSQGCARASLA